MIRYSDLGKTFYENGLAYRVAPQNHKNGTIRYVWVRFPHENFKEPVRGDVQR